MKFIYWLLRTLHLRPKAKVTYKDGEIHVDKLDPGEAVRIDPEEIYKIMPKK